MADRTLTINHADGGSETYTINRDKFAGVRDMTVDGQTVSVDHTAVPKEQDREKTFGGSQSITVKRDIEPLLSKVVGGASAAYSLRDLNDVLGNSNKVVRVRRSSDNAEKDFTASEMGAALEDWVGALNDGYVETWYDQSGNGNDATQTVTANQPKIVDGGSLLQDTEGLPRIDFYNNSSLESNAFADGSALSLFTVFNNQSANSIRKIFVQKLQFPNSGFVWQYRGDEQVGKYTFVNLDGSARALSYLDTTSPLRALSSAFINSSKKIFLNGISVASDSEEFVGGTNALTIGNGSFGTGFDIQEVVLYNSDQSANRTAIEANINNQYSIY